jgi:radical SAM superfamily enzyme YgiQ (UPF0313 family)
MYKGVPYRFHGLVPALADFSKAGQRFPQTRRIFLADGDVMHLDFQTLESLLQALNKLFQQLSRVSLYANGASILAKTDAELHRLRELKLHTLYMGLESGDEETLRNASKRETAAEMIRAGQQAQAAGLRISVMVLVGLAGAERSA